MGVTAWSSCYHSIKSNSITFNIMHWSVGISFSHEEHQGHSHFSSISYLLFAKLILSQWGSFDGVKRHWWIWDIWINHLITYMKFKKVAWIYNNIMFHKDWFQHCLEIGCGTHELENGIPNSHVTIVSSYLFSDIYWNTPSTKIRSHILKFPPSLVSFTLTPTPRWFSKLLKSQMKVENNVHGRKCKAITFTSIISQDYKKQNWS